MPLPLLERVVKGRCKGFGGVGVLDCARALEAARVIGRDGPAASSRVVRRCATGFCGDDWTDEFLLGSGGKIKSSSLDSEGSLSLASDGRIDNSDTDLILVVPRKVG